MVSEEQKYIASAFQIFGIACFTPLGQFVLNIREELIHFSFGTFIYLGFTIFLAYFGIILILKGSEYLIERTERKWISK